MCKHLSSEYGWLQIHIQSPWIRRKVFTVWLLLRTVPPVQRETLFQNQKSGSTRVWAKCLAVWEGRTHSPPPDVVGCESCVFVHLLWLHPCFTIETPWLCHSGKHEHPLWICIIFLFQPGWNSLPCRGAGSMGWPDSLRKYQEMLAGQNWPLYLKENNVNFVIN